MQNQGSPMLYYKQKYVNLLFIEARIFKKNLQDIKLVNFLFAIDLFQ